jgi:hypothetical protein
MLRERRLSDLEVYSKFLSELGHWQADDDLAGVREPGALAQLAEGEREAWRKFWEEVGDDLARPLVRP